MGEGQKIVLEHDPVDKLPAKLRRGLDAGMSATVTVEINMPAEAPSRRTLVSLIGTGQGIYATPVEAVDAIRTLRDE